MSESHMNAADSKTILEFRNYLDECERRCKDKIKRVDENRDENGEIRLGSFFGMQKAHEQLRDIEVVRSILQSFNTL